MSATRPNNVVLTAAEVLALMRQHVHTAGSQTAYAKASNLSVSVINEAINGRRDIPPSVLDALGLERRVTYVPKSKK